MIQPVHSLAAAHSGRLRRRCALLAGVLLAVSAAPARSQLPSARSAQRVDASRAELEAQAAAAERRGTKADRDRAAAIRDRLQRGDFGSGDQVILEIEGGEKPFSDTVTVRPGQVIRPEGFPEISVRGVLRSELPAHLTRELKRFVIAPRVTARPLVRLTVNGAVVRPGFYMQPYDLTVTDVIMNAGGPATNAKIDKIELRRGEKTIYDAESLQTAMKQGLSLDQLGVTNGDVIEVATQKGRKWTAVVQAATVALSLVGIIATIRR